MIGKYDIRIRNKFVTYEFCVKRKYTIIRGDSGTGKSYLCKMISEPSVERKCDVKLSVLPSNNWEIILANVQNQIIFVDESFKAIKSNDFASAMKRSDNYFVLITRHDLKAVPYSVSEIYNLSSKNND